MCQDILVVCVAVCRLYLSLIVIKWFNCTKKINMYRKYCRLLTIGIGYMNLSVKDSIILIQISYLYKLLA